MRVQQQRTVRINLRVDGVQVQTGIRLLPDPLPYPSVRGHEETLVYRMKDGTLLTVEATYTERTVEIEDDPGDDDYDDRREA